MNFYKLVSWPNVAVEQVLKALTVDLEINPYVRPISKDVQLTICKILNIDLDKTTNHNLMLVYFPPHSQINIHSDKPVNTFEAGKLDQALFLPLKSCDTLIWNWYEATDPSKIYVYDKSSDYKPVPILPYDAAISVEEIICDKPFISNIGQWHALKNTGDDYSLALSIRVMPWGWEDFKSSGLPPITGLTLL